VNEVLDILDGVSHSSVNEMDVYAEQDVEGLLPPDASFDAQDLQMSLDADKHIRHIENLPDSPGE
jgi:hypothetical protein